MDQRVWELQSGGYSPVKEQQLRFLLERRQLPEAGAQLPPLPGATAAPAPVTPPAAARPVAAATPAAGGGAATPPPPAAAAAAALFTYGPAAQPAPEGEAAAAGEQQQQRRRRRPRPDAAADGVQTFVGGRVSMRQEAGGCVLLTGALLHNIHQQLEGILCFERCQPGASRAPAWRSAWPLDDAEATFGRPAGVAAAEAAAGRRL